MNAKMIKICLALACALLGACSHAPDANQGKTMEDPAWKKLAELEARGVRANPYRAGRPATISRHGMVATSHHLASLAGLDMLRSGGNAVDAAIAAAAALGVVEPAMTGIGGDAWMLYYEASTRRVYALNGSGRSPRALTREYFASKPKPKMDDGSWEVITVPGAVDAYAAAMARFGSKPLAEVLAPAIEYAEDGFPVAEVVGRVWSIYADKLRRDSAARRTLLIDDQAPAVASVFKNPNLARSLRQIAEGGRDAFYEGPIAKEIVRYSNEMGGFLTLEDFAAHRSQWVEPVSVDYRGSRVWQCPPNGQGMGVLMMLNILEGFDLASMKLNSPEYLHLLIEAKKLAYADLYKFVADPEHSETPVEWLLSKPYAAERRALIDVANAAPAVDPGIPTGGDTIYLTTIDSEGNAVSFINSLFSPFGSGIVGGETGISLQNRGSGFTLTPGHFNEYAPGKRPYHTIIPGMVTRGGDLYMSYGLMGGAMQPQGHVQFLLSHLEFGLGIQEANDLPRWRHHSGLRVTLEHGTPRETMEALGRMGHTVKPAGAGDFGGAQAILIHPSTGVYIGSSDPRKDGAALGY